MILQEMQDALAKFKHTSDDCLNSFLATVEERQTPDMIYHYTNDAGMRGILESGHIWLTDIFNLNDPSELSHGVALAADILNRKAVNGPPESKEFARLFTDFLGGMQESAHYFVSSFSVDGDDLGQWRAYADNGRGYALGFDAKMLEGLFIKSNTCDLNNRSTFHVTYDDDQLVSIYSNVIDSMFELISLPQGKNLDSAIIREYLKRLSISLSLAVLQAALHFKHKAYEQESEFRFLQLFQRELPVPDLKFRHRSNELVQYREFAWREPGMLKRIVVGPAADRNKASRFAKDCLVAFHTGHANAVEISHSDIPYRAVGYR
jgi:hypothetical protein